MIVGTRLANERAREKEKTLFYYKKKNLVNSVLVRILNLVQRCSLYQLCCKHFFGSESLDNFRHVVFWHVFKQLPEILYFNIDRCSVFTKISAAVTIS